MGLIVPQLPKQLQPQTSASLWERHYGVVSSKDLRQHVADLFPALGKAPARPRPGCVLNGVLRVLAIYADPAEAHGHLAVLDPASGTLEDVSAPYTSFGPFYGSLAVAARPGGRVAVAAVGNSPVQPSQMALLEVRRPTDRTLARLA